MQASAETTHYGRIKLPPTLLDNFDLLRSPDPRKRANERSALDQPGRHLRLSLRLLGGRDRLDYTCSGKETLLDYGKMWQEIGVGQL